MSTLYRVRRDRSGGALIVGLLLLSMLMGIGALAVDMGMLYVARGDAQQAADAAALAGASAFMEIVPGSTVDSARARAVHFGTLNQVLRRPVNAGEVEVQVIRDSSKVRVSLRPAAVPTWFFRSLGLGSGVVGASSAAAVSAASTASCVKPFTPVDPVSPPPPPPPGRKRRTEWGFGGTEPYLYGQQITVYQDKSTSHAWVMPQSGGTTGSCPFQPTGSPNSTASYKSNICNCNMSVILAGAQHDTTFEEMAGKRKNATIDGVLALIAQDPAAYWDPVSGTVRGSTASNWTRSPRVVVIPLHDGSTPGRRQLQFTRFIRVFVESVDATATVKGRYLGVLGATRLVE